MDQAELITMDTAYQPLFFSFVFFVSAALFLLFELYRHSSFWVYKSCLENIHPKGVDSHEAVTTLDRLIHEDGAGIWPPNCQHRDWPVSLQPYSDTYFEMIQSFSTEQVSLDDEVNRERRACFRARMEKLLSSRIDMAEVERLMVAAEAGCWTEWNRNKYNGFYCCIAVCRHMYRWATMPVVKVAQEEQVIDFPPELDLPWPYLQRKFGVTAESGNNTANVLHNFNLRGERVYKINVAMSKLIRDSEETFFRMFYDLEVLASPMYREMVKAIVSFEQSERRACSTALQNVDRQLRLILQVFYHHLTEQGVSKTVWLSYVQGFQGWGVGRYIDGNFVKYDGLSGNHVLAFQAVDAFLGMDRYLTDENMDRYIPRNQRELCLTLKKHSFRRQLDRERDADLEVEFGKIVTRMKGFRAAHRVRVKAYLEQPAPERHTMTAGKSVLEGPSAKEALQVLDRMMAKRLQETI